MNDADERINVARQWVQKAENDLRTAAQTLKLKRDCPTDNVCFHAQQSVEKYLKALLLTSLIDFPRTHDLGELVARLPEGMHVPLTEQDQDRLTEYATTTRYPGDYEPISMEEARRAVRLARKFRLVARKALESKCHRQSLRTKL